MNTPLVSVIITTKNEELNIANCLESVLHQTYFCDKIEIIVVDNNSTDRTSEVVESFKQSTLKLDKLYNFQLLNRGPERSAQRNFGVAQSSGEYFLYLDADMILHKDVIKECVETIDPIKSCSAGIPQGAELFNRAGFRLDELVALYIPEIIMGESFWCKVRRFERSFYDGTLIDCARFIRKDKFLEVGGFDESMSGPEDWDLDRKLRQVGKTGLIASPIYHNEAEFDLKKYLDKKGYYAKSFGAYVEKWSRTDGSQSKEVKEEIDSEIKKQLGFYYRFIGVFIENGKWKKLIAHPILAAGVYCLRFLVGIKYLIG